ATAEQISQNLKLYDGEPAAPDYLVLIGDAKNSSVTGAVQNRNQNINTFDNVNVNGIRGANHLEGVFAGDRLILDENDPLKDLFTQVADVISTPIPDPVPATPDTYGYRATIEAQVVDKDGSEWLGD